MQCTLTSFDPGLLSSACNLQTGSCPCQHVSQRRAAVLQAVGSFRRLAAGAQSTDQTLPDLASTGWRYVAW